MADLDASAMPLLEMRGIAQALRRRARPGEGRLRLPAGIDSRGPGRERCRQVDADQDHLRRGPARRRRDPAGRAGRPLRRAERRQSGGHRRDLPGAVAGPRPQRRGQYLPVEPAAPVRPHRRPRAAAARRRVPGPARLRRPRSPRAGEGPAAVAAPAGGDRQGPGAAAAAADPGRGDLGPHGRRRRAGVPVAAQPAPRRFGPALHLAPDARDRGSRRHLLGVPQRAPRRDLPARRAHRSGDRPPDDRPRHRAGLSAQAGRVRRRRAASRSTVWAGGSGWPT